MRAMPMSHAEDPRETITKQVGTALDRIEVFSNQILVGVYVRPKVTAGGIMLPDQVQAEDKFQGKVGLVLKKGPMAFQNDRNVDFGGQDVQVGDWVVIRPSDGWAVTLGGQLCRVLDDVDVRLRVDAPDVVI